MVVAGLQTALLVLLACARGMCRGEAWGWRCHPHVDDALCVGAGMHVRPHTRSVLAVYGALTDAPLGFVSSAWRQSLQCVVQPWHGLWVYRVAVCVCVCARAVVITDHKETFCQAVW